MKNGTSLAGYAPDIVTVSVASYAGGTDSVFPFAFSENGLAIEGVDFGQVPHAALESKPRRAALRPLTNWWLSEKDRGIPKP